MNILSCKFAEMSFAGVILLAEKQHIHILLSLLTQPGPERSIYHTRGEHTNHYTTDE
jgi:hypothetical protein